MRWWIVPVGALLALGLWGAEVNLLLGWAGLAWLQISLAPRLIPLVIGVVLLAVGPRPGPARSALFLVLFWALAVGCYTLADGLLRSLYSPWLVFLVSGPEAIVAIYLSHLLGLVGCGLACAVGTWRLQRLLLGPAPLRLIPAYILALSLVLPLSLLSRWLLPWPKYSADLLHAIKAGWPAFWTTLLLGTAGLLRR